MKLYVKYSRIYPYLPEAVADSKADLARKLGTTVNVVTSSFRHGRSTYAEVEVDDMDNELKVGDAIKCADKEDLIDYMQGLEKMGYSTDFAYEMDGEKGLWLEITGIPS